VEQKKGRDKGEGKGKVKRKAEAKETVMIEGNEMNNG
jgi:hypothetical protein